MEHPRLDSLAASLSHGVSRRAALRRLGAGGIAAGLLSAVGLERRAAAQSATPTPATVSWEMLHLEVDLVPTATSITKAGGGPPQRGDFFYADAPIYAAGDAGGTQIGAYQCFGVWTHAATDNGAPDQRLTTLQYHLPDGAIMGLINEGGGKQAALVGAVQGGTERYVGAFGTFRQVGLAAGTIQTPGATPVGGNVVRAEFDLLLPKMS
jgi:hypothetical protein